MPYTPQRQWPPFSRDARDILDLFKSDRAVRVGGKLVCALDLEYNPDTNRPTILGLSDGALTVSVPYNDGINYFKAVAARHPDALVCGHNILGADCVVLAANGINLKLNQIEDTIVRHFLANQHLCKGAGKTEDGDEGKRGGGFMNLQTFATLYTSLPVWKCCRESECSGPCSTHDVFGYNAMDTVSCVLGLPEVRKQMLLKGVEKLYPMHRDLMALLAEMTETGVPIDLPYVQTLRDDFVKAKAELETRLPFNPKSPKQVAAYFKAQGLVLEDTTEETLRELAEDNESNEPLQMLVEYKALGNGVDRWFGDKYLGKDDRIHCRTGIFTSTARLNCIAKGTLIEVVRDVSKFPKGVPIEDVKEGDLAYAFDAERKLVLRKVLWSGKTGTRKVIRLHWQGQSGHHRGYLDLTPEHLVRRVDGSYVEASQLVPNDRVMAMSRGLTLGYARLWATGHKEISREHRFIFEQLYGWLPEHIHHKDHVQLNNLPSNLEAISPEDHARYHFGLYGASEEGKRLRSEQAKERWRTNRKEFEEKMIKRGPESHNWLGLTREWLFAELWEAKGSPVAVAKKHSIDYETLQKYMEREKVDWREVKKHFTAHGFQLTPEYIEETRKNFYATPQDESLRRIGLGYYKWKVAQERNGFVPYNHIVKKIEVLEKEVDVYDMTVEDAHNFIANEICVHNCVAPNLQNVSSRRKDAATGESFKTKIRRALIAPEGYYLMKSDYSNGENRVMLYHAGYPPITQDLHQWVADQMKLQEDDPFAQRLGGARNAAKSVQHGGNYGEGLSLLGDSELANKRIITEERAGARRIFRDWKVWGKTVTFTGTNLARRAFGQATYESRKKALDVQEMYFGNFPKLRELQRKIMKQAETERVVRPPHGYCLNSYGDLTDQLKTSLATWGSQPLAHLTKLALLKLKNNNYGIIPALQIHDEIIIFVPDDVPPEVAKRVLVAAMDSETPEMPGLTIPCDVSFSTDAIAKELSGGRSTRSNWADTKKI